MFPGSYFPKSYFAGSYFPIPSAVDTGVSPNPLPVPVHADIRLEMYLPVTVLDVDQIPHLVMTWVDMLGEHQLRNVPIVCEYGRFTDDQTELIDATGSLTFSLNNAASNGGALGWYSPLHTHKRQGFGLDTKVRLRISDGVTDSCKFHGKLSDIEVIPGVHNEKMVHCTALNLMDDYARIPVPALETQYDKRGDELMNYVLDSLPTDIRPRARSVEASTDTYPIALDKATEESMTVRELLHDIAASELATIGFKGTTSTVPEPTDLFYFRTRQPRPPSVIHHFELDILRRGLRIPHSRDDLSSMIQVTGYSTRVDTSSVVLYDLQSTNTLVAPFQVYTSLFGPYRDPNNTGARVGGRDMISPAATTDYTMNTLSDGTGADLTANFSVVASFTQSGVHFTITNNGGTAGYITKLQVRGKGIYREPVVVPRTVASVPVGHKTTTLEMPYQSNVNVLQDVADHLVSLASQSQRRVSSISFLATSNVYLLGAFLSVEPGSYIAIREEMSGIDDAIFEVRGVRCEMTQGVNGLDIWCTWFLAQSDTSLYFLLGSTGRAELGSTTYLGY